MKRIGLFLVIMVFVLALATVAKAEDEDLDKDCKNAFVTDAVFSVLGAVNLQYQREISRFFNFDISIATAGYGEVWLPGFTLRINPFGQGLKGLYIGPKVLVSYDTTRRNDSIVGFGLESGYEWILWNFLVLNPGLEGLALTSGDDVILVPFPIPSLRIGYAW